MIDKILYLNSNYVALIFTDRPPITVSTDDGTAYALALEILQRRPMPEETCLLTLEVA